MDEIFYDETFYIVLAKPAYGKPRGYLAYDMDTAYAVLYDVPGAYRVIGPYEVGPEGYEAASNEIENDPGAAGIEWTNPETWITVG